MSGDQRCLFYLGSHIPSWLWSRQHPPLFVSDRTLKRVKKLKRSRGRWALDSGGFTELSMNGRWTTTAEEYSDRVERYSRDIGGLDFAAIQDWMCEPHILAKTGHDVAYHQDRSVYSYHELRALKPSLPWLPVLQGWTRGDYIECLRKYRDSGYLGNRFGVGSVCRRQGSEEIRALLEELYSFGLELHGFGVKKAGLAKSVRFLSSADSLAWSFGARRTPIRLNGCSHQNCANCYDYAVKWLGEIHEDIPGIE